MAAQHFSGVGAPNGVVFGNPGDIYQDETGALWFKTAGVGTDIGWTASGGGGGGEGPSHYFFEQADPTLAIPLAGSNVTFLTSDVIDLAAAGKRIIVGGFATFVGVLNTGAAVPATVRLVIIRDAGAKFPLRMAEASATLFADGVNDNKYVALSCIGSVVDDGAAHDYSLQLVYDNMLFDGNEGSIPGSAAGEAATNGMHLVVTDDLQP